MRSVYVGQIHNGKVNEFKMLCYCNENLWFMPVGIPIDILSSITETVKNNIVATMTKGHNDKDNKHDDDDDDDDDDYDTNQNRNAKVTSNEQNASWWFQPI